jgi:hypothetical protein
MKGPAVDFPFIGYLPCRLDQQTQTHGLLHHALSFSHLHVEFLASDLGCPGQTIFSVQDLAKAKPGVRPDKFPDKLLYRFLHPCLSVS